jgi:hypothetical protein
MCRQILIKITNVKFQISLVESALFHANLHINTQQQQQQQQKQG